MNISQPVASYIGSVGFGFLSPEEVKSLSVKKIQNPTTFDTLLHPTPGGLYDPALGAWGDNMCSTCHLNSHACPGHVGHIELPVPVFNVTFMAQMMRLLRSQCSYCGRLKLRRAEVNRFACKLKLIQHGLLQESEELENIQLRPKSEKSVAINGSAAAMVEGSDESEEDEDSLVDRRNAFVRQSLKRFKGKNALARMEAQKVEVVAEQRRAVVKEFLSTVSATRTCGSCKGVSPYYRKDKYNKIFRMPLGARDKAKMVQGGFKAINPLVKLLNERKAMQMQKGQDYDIDEGIVADLEDVSSNSDGEDIQMLDLDEGENTDDLSNDPKLPAAKSTKPKAKEADVYVNAHEVHASLSDLFNKEEEILQLVYNSQTAKHCAGANADLFFIRNILVPPNKFRPETRTGENEIAESANNSLYKQILMQCEYMHELRRKLSSTTDGETNHQGDFGQIQEVWVKLQDAVNSLIDSSKSSAQVSFGRVPEEGIKQKLEKKEGLFRMNMMGKRVNFAARSVISPDPNIETNEIGVPPVFAKKLTYPEPVTSYNFYELKEAVLNGVDRWPGAAAVENENGQVINLRTKNFEERQALANQLLAPSNTNVNGARSKKVHRHLNNGDIVLMNRQPTLHKPSMMAHRARVLPGEKTLRLHYANCNSYNADFDGDEMNMHFPQNEVARAEALQIADTDHQYLVATSGKPLRGLIQDHISMGIWLTNRDTFFDREDYYQLLCGCLRPENNHTTSARIETIIPAIVKPRCMWTGKQVVTSVLRNITPATHPGLNLHGKSQVAGDRWGNASEEDMVIFRDGELLCGILDKAHLGPSTGGFVHAVYEVYGHTIAGKLLSVLGRLLTKMLHMRAFSCGIEDLVLTQEGDKRRQEKLKDVQSIGLEVAAKYVTLDSVPGASDEELQSRLEEVLRDDGKQTGLDLVYNSRTSSLSSDITSTCLLSGLRKSFPQNQMQTMTTSGAKGSLVNANFISCNLGQQVLEGRRVPVMISGKTLPSFKAFETNVRAGGYITDRFLTGVKPQEYYFHAMAGREGLIDTAVKTSRSGYLQRCLIKGMEGVKVEYDSSVRDSDGTMIQFLYGEDGLDVTKQKYLRDFRFMADNHLSLVAQLNIREEFSKIPDNGAAAHQKNAMKKVRKSGDIGAADPALALFNPGSNLGSTSESFASAVKDYCERNPDGLLRDKKKSLAADLSGKGFRALLDIKYMKSVVDPGEAVGVIAGQSVGEPSTQMTLNTFHLAGHSANNVTMGIPRLREIVMTASKQMSTPTMTLHLNPELTKKEGENFAKGITKLTLAEVMEEASVSERVEQKADGERAKVYDVKLDLFPSEEYKSAYAIEVVSVLRSIEFRFIPQLLKAITKELKHFGDKGSKLGAEGSKVGESVGPIPSHTEKTRRGGDDDEDDEDEDDEDEDATNTKQKLNRGEAISYAAPDEGEEAIAREAQRDSTPDADIMDEGYGGSPRENQEDDANEDDDGSNNENERVALAVLTKEREQRITAKHVEITKFSFDDKGGSWCKIRLEYDIAAPKLLMLNLVESACRSAIIQAIPGLGACTYTYEKVRCPVTGTQTSVPVIVTTGVNLRAMHDHQGAINPHQLFTNDINAMLQLYGVEAARATIIREMDAVFKDHSIAVDPRHLNLIADVMTRGGDFTAFNRTGLKCGTSPFMKMSFETTVGFLRDAVLEGDFDDLKGPSARIVVGRVGGWGTGAFDVLLPVG